MNKGVSGLTYDQEDFGIFKAGAEHIFDRNCRPWQSKANFFIFGVSDSRSPLLEVSFDVSEEGLRHKEDRLQSCLVSHAEATVCPTAG